MVGGLVDQKEAVIPGKQGGQEHLGLLPAGKGGKGAAQNVLRHVQLGDFLHEPPHLALRVHVPGDVQGRFVFVRNGERKVIEGHRRAHRAAAVQFPGQDAQQGGLAPAVAADEPQLPIRVDLEGSVIKNQVRASFISKCQMRYLYPRHKIPPNISFAGRSASSIYLRHKKEKRKKDARFPACQGAKTKRALPSCFALLSFQTAAPITCASFHLFLLRLALLYRMDRQNARKN